MLLGLNTEPERLVDIRKNQNEFSKRNGKQILYRFEKIKKEVDEAKTLFKKYKWPTIDVTRKSVEETAASIIKIYEIYKKMVEIILASKSKVRKEMLDENNYL